MLRDVTYSIGVDLGGTKILAGLVGPDGVTGATLRRPTPRQDPDAALAVVAEMVMSLIAQADREVVSVGLDVPGPCDAEGAVVFFAPNLGWHDVPVRAMLAARIDLPVMVENDGNAAAWGEFRFGAGEDIDEFTMVTVGTGIGGGIIVDGQLLRGAHGAAAEIGHMNVVVDGRPCGCGRFGCWEQYASGNALVREARDIATSDVGAASVLLALGDGTVDGITGAHITEAARIGCPASVEAFDRVGTWLGRGLADLVAILDPRTFVVGGGVCEAGELLLASTRSTLSVTVAGGQDRPVPDIRIATLGNDAGLIGAADLARRHA